MPIMTVLPSLLAFLAVFAAKIEGIPTKFKQFEGTPILLEHSGWKPVKVNIVPIYEPTPIPLKSRQFEEVEESSEPNFDGPTIQTQIPENEQVLVEEKKRRPRRRKESYDNNKKGVKILRHSASVSQKDNKAYHFDFQSENGITRTEDGYLKNLGENGKNPAQVMSGSYSYIGPDGKTYTITYVADENGFRAEGSHLPQSVAGK